MKSRFTMAFVAATVLVAPRAYLAGDASMDRPGRSGEESSGGAAGEPAGAPVATEAQETRGVHAMGTGHGETTGGMECCAGMTRADVTAENTPDGAVLRFKAKDRADVSRIQRMAHRLESCMGSGAARERATEQK